MRVDFLGHFHPLLIHLPIGILLFAALLEYAFPKRNSRQLMLLLLLLGVITTTLSALLGWILSFSGDYDAALLDKHKWAGISLSVVTIVLWGWKLKGVKLPNYSLISHMLFGIMLITLSLAGHYGGSLTHGEDFLSFSKISSETDKTLSIDLTPVTDTTKGSVYDKLITPVLATKCFNCHNASKKKGNLRMQTYEALIKGGKTGPAIKPGDLAHSELIKRISLDIMDDKRMPPRGKKQLSNDETRLLYWWIQNGASTTTTLTEVKKNDTIRAFLTQANEKGNPEPGLPKIKKADSLLLAKLKNTQWELHTLSKESPYLDLSAISFPALNNEQLNSITGLAPNIAWLNLANTQINDQAMGFIGQCTNLVKLTLMHTDISSSAITEIKKLTRLSYINLINTKWDDNGLRQLCEMPALKKIYCWNTLVTKQGVEACRKKYPGILIDNGDTDDAVHTLKP